MLPPEVTSMLGIWVNVCALDGKRGKQRQDALK